MLIPFKGADPRNLAIHHWIAELLTPTRDRSQSEPSAPFLMSAFEMRLVLGLLLLGICVAAVYVLTQVVNVTEPVGRSSLILLILSGCGALYAFVKA